MIDKNLMDAINENNKIEYKNWIKNQKRKERIKLILNLMVFLAVLSVVLVWVSTINHIGEKNVKKCIKKGYSYNYCIKDVN